MSEWIQAQGKQVKRQLMYYITCPKCAKHYGKNYVVILAEVRHALAGPMRWFDRRMEHGHPVVTIPRRTGSRIRHQAVRITIAEPIRLSSHPQNCLIRY
ncbi:MAG: hypothetical protein KA191_15445 [Verrucomicrobia bacterium]|nr:hypothetical protein [Verrucomicrobiota bacterium]OQC67625.1 MAG: hypothetical protein BWX48_00618 [Verrucomicrobia bacterium ADurb.Bin006]MDI9380363.1 hypothetical protein [Verrucomicrobiota bacterium]NMD20326.1 hypothetical protein [Verrucomicrobiota bacterium]HOF49223.1 hypothetical protein [Verrucomicrobiota bacterium]